MSLYNKKGQPTRRQNIFCILIRLIPKFTLLAALACVKELTQAKAAITEDKPIWHLQSMLQLIHKQWQEIEEKHLKLLITESTLDHCYFTEENFDATLYDYEITAELLLEKLKDDYFFLRQRQV